MKIPIIEQFPRFLIIIKGGQGKQTLGHISCSVCMHRVIYKVSGGMWMSEEDA